MSALAELTETLETLPRRRINGTVSGVRGTAIAVDGLSRLLGVGDKVRVSRRQGASVLCETVGFDGASSLVMPFARADAIGPGCQATVEPDENHLFPDTRWCGRVINAMGRPIDQGPAMPRGTAPAPYRPAPLNAYARTRIGARITTGIRAIDGFTPVCAGQRLGIFAGSGVGKSTLLSMLARFVEADVVVIGLIGERGREVQDFIQDTLGEAGLSRAVLVVSTADEPPAMRRQAAYTTLAVAEAFRDQGKHVLCLIDSVTRFAMAQREIGLAAGEPPTSKGYPPSVFSELAQVLERAGPGPEGSGSITGLFSVLVEGGDHDEPVADAVRGILDGHLVLDRKIAERGRYPAIDVLASVSRTVPNCLSAAENDVLTQARRLLSDYEDMRELIRIGAYKDGSNPITDRAIKAHDPIATLLTQAPDETHDADVFESLNDIVRALSD